LKRATSIVLIAIMLLQITAVVFAAENATENWENSSKNLPQEATQELAPTAPPAVHSQPKPTTPGFEATFAAVGFLAVSFIILRRRI
jgi:hypothetical protein